MNWRNVRVRWIALGVVVALVIATLLIWALRDRNVPPPVQAELIIGRGRLEPTGRVHLVSGPSEGGTVAELRVNEGDSVRRGQILAVLDRYDSADANVIAGTRDLQLSRLQDRQVSAGAKQEDIVAQDALIASREAELRRARAQFDRADSLKAKGFVSVDTLEERELVVRQAQEALSQARAARRAMTQTRPIDQDVAQAQVAVAQSRLKGAEANRERSLIRAPIDGTVLALYVRSGGTLGVQGLLTVGDIRQMIAVGEFDEEVATRIHVGQRVTVTLRGNKRPFLGRIARVLNDVSRNSRSTSDVLNGRDARIAEAEIHFDPGQPVPRLVGAEAVVTVTP